MDPGHWLQSAAAFLHRYPSLWPAAFCLLFFPTLLAVSRSARLSALLARIEPRVLRLWGLAGIGIFVFCDLAYLTSPAFFDFFEGTGVSVAYTVFQGGVAFPDISSVERYCLPYGPILYLVLGSSQWLLGASTFSSKLPSCLAAVLAIGLFWRILRRRGLSPTAACVLTGLNATILLGFREVAFWTKSDALISLVVTVGIWAALRRSRLASALLGACIGLGIGLKITAGVYFLPVLAIACHTGWNRRDFVICGSVLLASVLFPFVLFPGQFPWLNYLAFFRTVTHEGFQMASAFGFLRWVAMLTGLIAVSDLFIRQSMTPQSRRRRWACRAALACGFALVAIPACAVGSGPHHLMPFVPLALLSFGDLLARDDNHEWRYSGKPLRRTVVYAIFSGCLLVAMQTAFRIVQTRIQIDGQARACEADLRQILTRHPQSTILMGTSSGDEAQFAARFRYQLVFAGNPIGLDAAVVSDYQFGGLAEPDLPRLLKEIHQRDPRPILWLLPRGGSPFTSTNWYGGHLPIYSDGFRRDFSERFQSRERTAFFDIYFPTEKQ